MEDEIAFSCFTLPTLGLGVLGTRRRCIYIAYFTYLGLERCVSRKWNGGTQRTPALLSRRLKKKINGHSEMYAHAVFCIQTLLIYLDPDPDPDTTLLAAGRGIHDHTGMHTSERPGPLSSALRLYAHRHHRSKDSGSHKYM